MNTPSHVIVNLAIFSKLPLPEAKEGYCDRSFLARPADVLLLYLAQIRSQDAL